MLGDVHPLAVLGLYSAQCRQVLVCEVGGTQSLQPCLLECSRCAAAGLSPPTPPGISRVVAGREARCARSSRTTYLHPVDLGLHGTDLCLPRLRIHRVAHLFGQLDFLLPEHDLVSSGVEEAVSEAERGFSRGDRNPASPQGLACTCAHTKAGRHWVSC